jgi:hypothetical protein
MNTLIAASLFDSPWVLLVIVLVGALSQWLMKRRQRNQAENQPEGDESLPSLGKPQERSPRELDLQEVLRELLGGEPPPRAPQPPPVPPVMQDAQRSEGWLDEEQFQRKQSWRDEPQETLEATRPPAIQTDLPPQRHASLARAEATRLEAERRQRDAARRFEQLNEQARHPATVVNTARGLRSRTRARAVALVRDTRTVRQAFIASLVFGPPKAFETSHL